MSCCALFVRMVMSRCKAFVYMESTVAEFGHFFKCKNYEERYFPKSPNQLMTFSNFCEIFKPIFLLNKFLRHDT